MGPGLNLAPHLNVAATIAVSLADAFQLRTWTHCRRWSGWQSCLVSLIPSGTLHHLQSTGPMAFLYMDPLMDGLCAVDEDQLTRGRSSLLRQGKAAELGTAFDAFDLPSRRPRDERITRVVLEIERRPCDFRSLQQAASLACLSPSRFRARFMNEVGLPFRRYRLWRRMALVMRAVASGSNLTEAAHLSGFASSSHLSAAFKTMFGLSASDILGMGVSIVLSE